MSSTDSNGNHVLTWPSGHSITVSAIEKIEAVEAIRKIMHRYHALDALVIFQAIGELVSEGEIKDGSDFVLALNAQLGEESGSVV